MINDNEGMDDALEYYVDGDNTAYWKEFVRRLDDRLERWAEKKVNEEMQSYWGDWTDEDPYTNVDSDEDYEEANGVSEEQDDDYYDYDDEWEDFDWDNEELEKEKDNNNEK